MSKAKMQMPCVLLGGAPTTTTVGWVGLLAMNTASSDGDLYKCIKAENGVYTWKPLGSGGGGGSGAGGFSPVAIVEQTDDGALITITDQNGTTSALARNGYTPQKGIDYLTEADKQETVNAVLAALPAAEGVDF